MWPELINSLVLVAFGVSTLSFIVVWILKLILALTPLKPIAEKISALLISGTILLASLWWQISDNALKPWLVVGICILAAWQISRLTSAIVKHNLITYKTPFSTTYVPLMMAAVRIGLGLLVGLVILDAFGVNVMSLVAGLGISGIIVALAVQSVLGDVFNALTLSLDQSLKPGDFINVGKQSGKLEAIGLKMSRVKALSGEMVLIPNQQLVSEPISNFRNISTRRIVIELWLPHSVPVDVLKKLPESLATRINKVADVNLDRVHVSNLSSQGISLEIVAHIKATEYVAFMDIKQALLLSIKEGLEIKQITPLYQPSSVSLLPTDPA